jgi:hypothetical protein
MYMNPDQDQHRRNRLLAALRPGDYALLEPHLQIVPILEGEFMHLPGEEIEQVYFLHRGIVALMAISKEGDTIATASVGSEGAIGTIAGTGFVRAFTRAMVQAAGVASRIAVPHFRRAGGPCAGSFRSNDDLKSNIQVCENARASPKSESDQQTKPCFFCPPPPK